MNCKSGKDGSFNQDDKSCLSQSNHDNAASLSSDQFVEPGNLPPSDQSAYFKNLAEAASDGIFVLDEQGRFEYANDGAFRTIQWPKDEIIGHHFLKVIPPESYLLVMTEWQNALAGKNSDYEVEVIQKDGTRKHILLGHRPMWVGGKRKFGLCFKDISAQKSLEQQLIKYRQQLEEHLHHQNAQLDKTEHLYQLLIENIDEPITVIDEDGCFRYINPKAASYMGKKSHEVNTKTLWDVFGQQQGELRFALLTSMFASGGGSHCIEDCIILDGQEYWFEMRTWPLPRVVGEKRCLISVSRDINQARRFQTQLQKSEQRYRMLVENLGQPVGELDEHGVILYLNEAGFQLLTDIEANPIDKNIRDLFPGEPGEQLVADILWVIQEQKSHYAERLAEVHGQCRWYETKIWPLMTDPGHQRKVVIIAQDITVRKHNWQAMEDSEYRFRLLADGTFEGLLIHDKGIIVEANTNYAKILGYSSVREILGKNAFDFLPPESREIARRNYDSGYEGIYELQSVDCSGRYHDIEVHGQFIIWRGRRLRVLSCRDVTEQRKSQKALMESEARSRILSESAFEGIVIHDQGIIMDCNQAYAQILGRTRDELLATSGWTWVHPDDLKMIKEKVAGDYLSTYEIRVIRRDGSVRYLEVRGRPIEWQGRKLRVGSLRDITERRVLEQELANYRRNLQEMQTQMYVGAMGAFLGHELNQPLTVLNLLLSQALDTAAKAQACQPLQDLLQKSINQIRRAEQTVSKFRKVSKVSTFGIDKAVSIVDILQKLREALLYTCQQNKIEIVVDESVMRLPKITFSPLALEQICMVLMQNAVEAADPKVQNHLRITGCMVPGGVNLSFCDDCGGISPENESHVFDPFFTTKTGNLGLGLDIVYRILLSCGGSVVKENDFPRGCCFRIYLPVS